MYRFHDNVNQTPTNTLVIDKIKPRMWLELALGQIIKTLTNTKYVTGFYKRL